MKRFLHNLCRDDRGAISVLTILTLWCLVALLAMLWNTAEYAKRRRDVQNAADSAAQASATWVARTTNAVAEQNMVICRDASAEAIWRACLMTGGDPRANGYPNSGSIYNELMRERNDAANGQTRIRGLATRLRNQVIRVETEYAFTLTALQALNANLQGNFGTPAAQNDYATQVRQANSALAWVENTYLHGQWPSAGRPTPPGPNMEGLLQLVDKWNISESREQEIFQRIMDHIDYVQIPVLRDFQSQTYAATSQPLDQILQQHEQQVFQQQQSERDSLPLTIDEQRQKIQGAYNTTITYATMRQLSDIPTATIQHGLAGSGQVGAPIITPFEADGTQGLNHSDTIRHSSRIIPWDTKPPEPYYQYFLEGNYPLDYDIDPISPNTGPHQWANGTAWEDAEIIHPPMPIYPGGTKVWLDLNAGWGQLWLMPLERYLSNRIYRDQQALRAAYMVQLDNKRNAFSSGDGNIDPTDPSSIDKVDLKTQILAMQKVLDPGQSNTNISIANLPTTIPDDQANPQGGIDQITVLPKLQNPDNGAGPFDSNVQSYNTHSRAYISDIHQLRNMLLSYVSAYQEFYVSFAVRQWGNAVFAAQGQVMHDLTDNGYFMILGTYKLRYIPEWAKQTMYNTIRDQVADHIAAMNTIKVVNQLASNVQASGLQPYALAAAADIKAEVLSQGYADEITEEFLDRPWPYEIIPPGEYNSTRPQYVPTGIPRSDRENFFSAIAWVTDNTGPRLLLSNIFGKPQPLTAYAQGESFNWMEFNSGYGGADVFDSPTRLSYGAIDPSGTFFGEIACPRGWRLATTAGANWQPRLAISDALANALRLNPNIDSQLNTGSDDLVFDPINMH